jgi:hypothetical protein
MKFTLYIGIERDRNGNQVDPVQRAQGMKELRRLAVTTFGGYTIVHAEGNDGSGPESVVRLETFTSYDKAVDFARAVGQLFGQRELLLVGDQSPVSVLVPVPVNDPRHVPGIMTPGPMTPIPAPVPFEGGGQ